MKTIKTIHIGGNQNILILYIRRNILQWTRVGKLESLKDLHDERERREKGEHKLRRENSSVLTNEDRASLNRQKRNLE